MQSPYTQTLYFDAAVCFLKDICSAAGNHFQAEFLSDFFCTITSCAHVKCYLGEVIGQIFCFALLVVPFSNAYVPGRSNL